MTDIVIYTNPEVLEHKKGADGGQIYYWTLSRFPKRLLEEIPTDVALAPDFTYGRIFFAVKGFVVGSFEIIEINQDDEETIVWDKDSWVELKEKIPTKPFQGFRYRWWN